MTELTTYQQANGLAAASSTPPTAPVDYQTRAVHRLSEWAVAAEAAYHVAETLVRSSFVPVQYRGNPIDAMGAILAGAEVGLSPMSALKAFDVINGQSAPRAITLRAIAQSHGHDIEVIETNSTRCVVRARRRGGNWQQVTWTIDRARDLGLAGKAQWRQQPATMLIARATTEAARLVAADAILGIGYSAEELEDLDDGAPPVVATIEPAPAPPSPAGTRRMSRPRASKPTTPEPPQVEQITPAQQKALHAALRDAGAGDRGAGLALIGNIVRRDVESTKDLTKDEASTIIDTLKQPAPEPQAPDDDTVDGDGAEVEDPPSFDDVDWPEPDTAPTSTGHTR